MHREHHSGIIDNLARPDSMSKFFDASFLRPVTSRPISANGASPDSSANLPDCDVWRGNVSSSLIVIEDLSVLLDDPVLRPADRRDARITIDFNFLSLGLSSEGEIPIALATCGTKAVVRRFPASVARPSSTVVQISVSMVT